LMGEINSRQLMVQPCFILSEKIPGFGKLPDGKTNRNFK